MPAYLRLALAALIAAACAGCSFKAFTYTADRYGLAKPVNVRLACRDTYEVFDRADLGSLLVATNPLNEILVCGDGGAPALAQRQREVAEIFLAETSRRPLCRIGGEAEISDRHREFTYRCPPGTTAYSPMPSARR